MGEAAFGADAVLNFWSEAGKPKASFVAHIAHLFLSQESWQAMPCLPWEGAWPCGAKRADSGDGRGCSVAGIARVGSQVPRSASCSCSKAAEVGWDWQARWQGSAREARW